MFKPEVTKISTKTTNTIKEVMKTIDLGGIGTAFIVDNKNQLVGSVTDGDIRKAILKGLDVSQEVASIMNDSPIFLYEHDLNNNQKVLTTVQELIGRSGANIYMPIVDKKRQLKDLVLCSKLIRLEKKTADNRKQVKRVLVVGGAGFLGSVLVRKLLQQDFYVRVLDVLMFGDESLQLVMNHPRFELVKGDMRDISVVVAALKDVDAVVNLAAIVGDPACKKYPERTIETNYLANKLLAEACKYHQINRFIYASTCSVYGVGNGKLDENAPLNPVSLYARSKIQSEDAILSLMDENFSPCILRMSTLYGLSPRMRFDLVVNTMTLTAVKDRVINILGGKQWRPLLHIADAADAYIKCLKAPIEVIRGQVFNVGSDQQNYRIVEIGRMVKEGVPYSRLKINKETTDARNYIVSFSKIERKFNYHPKITIPVAVREIRRALESGAIKNVKDQKYYNVGDN